MFKASGGALVGVAALALGLSLACPQCLAVATADGVEEDSAAVSAGPAKSAAPAGRAGSRSANTRAAASSGADAAPSAVPADPVAVTPADAGDGVPMRQARMAASPSVRIPAAAAARQRSRPARAGQLPEVNSVAGLSNVPASPASVPHPVSSAAEVAVAPAAAVSRVAASGVDESAPKRSARGAANRAIAAPRAMLDSPAVAAAKFLDAASEWLSRLPGNPITEFLQGALLLVRRTFFNVGADGSKPGLIASDWLTVEKTTGEVFGDEPVMVTVMLTTTLGQDGGTRTRLVDSYPNQIKSGVDASDKVAIPNEDGDAWIDYAGGQVTAVHLSSGGSGYDALRPPTVTLKGGGGTGATAVAVVPDIEDEYGNFVDYVGSVVITDPGEGYTFAPEVIIEAPGSGQTAKAVADIDRGTLQPLTLQTFLDAQSQGAAVRIPVVATVTLMLEGDLTKSSYIADMGRLIEDALKEVAVELEKTELVIGDPPDGAAMKKVIKDAMSAIEDRFAIDPWKGNAGWLGYAAEAVLQRLKLWAVSVADPDDPVGLSATVLIPVDENFLLGLDSLSYDPRTICEVAAQCAVDYVRVTSGGRYSTLPEVVLAGGHGLLGAPVATARLISDRGVDESGKQYFYVKGVEVIDKGSGYSTAPTVVFDGGQPFGSGEAASATAFLDKAFLDENYLGVKTLEIRNVLWDTNIELRYGFLVPPEALYDKKAQHWTTNYAGDYVDNDWAEYKVDTVAWPRVTW